MDKNCQTNLKLWSIFPVIIVHVAQSKSLPVILIRAWMLCDTHVWIPRMYTCTHTYTIMYAHLLQACAPGHGMSHCSSTQAYITQCCSQSRKSTVLHSISYRSSSQLHDRQPARVYGGSSKTKIRYFTKHSVSLVVWTEDYIKIST